VRDDEKEKERERERDEKWEKFNRYSK